MRDGHLDSRDLLLESWARVIFATACSAWGAWFLFGAWGAGTVLLFVGLVFFAASSLMARARERAQRRATQEPTE